MKWFENSKISCKLFIGFIVVAITSGLIGYFCSTISSNNTVKIFVILLTAVVISIIINLIIYPTIYKPIKELTNALSKVAAGEINVSISTETTGEIGDFANALNELVTNIKNYKNSIKLLAENIVEGNLDERIDAKNYKGFYGEMVNNVNIMLNSVIEPLIEAENVLGTIALNDYTLEMSGKYKGTLGEFKEKVNSVRARLLSIQDAIIRVSKGDTSRLEEFKKIGKRSENDKMMPSVTNMMETIHNLIAEVNMLTKNSVAGNLNVKGDVNKFEGEYRYVIEGINNTLDAVITPLNEVNVVLGKLAVNDYSQSITGHYEGGFKELSDSVNGVHTRLVSLLNILIDISEGNIDKLHDWKNIGKRSENDKILPSVINAMQTIKDLIDETGMLIDAATDGKLDVRGNAEQFKGGYKEIIDGVNRMLNTMIKPIKESSEVIDEMAKGNLQVAMKGEYKGDYEKIKLSLNSAVESFNEVLNSIKDSAQQVASGAKQVSDSTQMLSEGSTEQASSIEELTASLEQISSQTKQNAGNADQANELALNAKEDATRGNNQMKNMVDAMNEINESSSNISKIIKVIDEIAFQTNILSLNAAVEAARAGQYGKGFAVVAEEVRNLAARSANAAKETTTLIEGSIKKVEAGTQIANETAAALNKIVGAVSKAADLVGEIANASNEQATGIEQINQGVIQVSQVVQTNSATSEENATSSKELANQAEVLQELVSRFKLEKAPLTYSSFEKINPEVFNMLKNMSQKNKISSYNTEDIVQNEVAATTNKIILSDNEFGKY